MRVRLIVRLNTKDGWKEPGHVIDHPDAYKLMRRGLAEEVPDAARVRAQAIQRRPRA